MKNTKIMTKSLALFAREIIASPRLVGAALPSSKVLARVMAKQVPLDSQHVLELGAGTGAVTRELLRRIMPEKLTIIERSPAFITFLHQHFSSVNIIEGDASYASQFVKYSSDKVDVIVSSLPLRSLP